MERRCAFTSDHGDMMGDRGLFFKTTLDEGSARIPMIMAMPRGQTGRRMGRVVDAPVGLADLLPTILDLAGAEDVRPRDGRSLAGFASGDDPYGPGERVLHAVFGADPLTTRPLLTDGRTKYTWHRWGGVEELFRPLEDPCESYNLALEPGHGDELGHWRSALVARLREVGASDCLAGDELASLEAPLPPNHDRRARDPFGRRPH